ncbi:MAG: FAD-dependent monooxygenase [Campylobacterota bacterium]|nr:FAD-dependent monooxygenase [Campylobacterota bacterium]
MLIQRNFSFKKPCGGGIRKDGFEKFDLDEKEIIKTVDTAALVHKDRRVDIDISRVSVAIVDRVSFDHYLRVDAEKKGTQLYEASFVSMEIFDTHIVSKIKRDDVYSYIKSNYVVAADGVNSKIRKAVNGDEVSSIMTHYCDIESQNFESCDFHLGKDVAQGHYAWIFPHKHGSNIGTVANSLDSLENLKLNIDLEEDVKNFGYKIPIYKNPIFYKNRVFFVGDSASQVLPFTYEGIYYSLASAQILSEIIINKENPKEYEKVWKKKFQKKFDVLLKLQKIFLYNDFMIRVLLKLFKSKSIQQQTLKLWIGEEAIKVDFSFFVKVLKHIFRRT